MKNRLFIITAVVFFAFFSETGWALIKSRVKNPIGPATVPPSSLRSGLLRSPNPIDTSGNLLITGNVRGDRHFRGIVPYRSTSDFGAPLGSSSLDSFLRRSAGPGDFGRFSGTRKPYYSPTATVTTTRPGLSGVFRPSTTKIGVRAVDKLALREEALFYPDTAGSSIRFRSILQRFSPQELEKLILDGVATSAEAERLVDEQNLSRMERLRQDLKQLRNRAPQLRQSLVIQDESLRPFNKLEQMEDGSQPSELQRPEEQAGEEDSHFARSGKTGPDRELDVYEQMKQQMDDLQKTLEQLRVVEQSEEAADGEGFPPAKNLRRGPQKKPGERASQKESSPLDELSDIELSVKAKEILGEHKTFASFSKDRFNQYLRAGEDYLRQGRYYRAADAYTLAALYKPSDPLAYAGKSHALFAAGEYVSSALFLSRAIDIFPEYARFKIDIVAMVGDRDKLESRIADVELWVEKNGAAELQFLLGYVYYQMGRPERAKAAIDAAYEKMPDSSAVIALKKAIDDTVDAAASR